MKLHDFYIKIWERKIPQLLFYIGLTIELGIVIIDKSNYANPIEGQLFRLTFLIFALKLILTEYTPKERWLIFFFEVIAVISYQMTGKNDVIRIVTFVTACKGIPLKQMMRYTFYVTFAGCAVIVLLSVTGIYGEMRLTMDFGRDFEMDAWGGEAETRYTLGMGHPNALACMFLMTLALGLYGFAERLKWYGYLFLLLLSVGIYRLTDSKTSVLITIFLLLGAFIMSHCRFLREKGSAYFGGALIFILCLAFSIDAAVNAQNVREAEWNAYYYENPRADGHIVALMKIDGHLNRRIVSLTDSEKNDGMVGTWSAFSCPNNMTHYFDMGWVKLFYRYGIVPGTLYCLACLALLWKFYRKKDAYGLVIFTMLAIYSVVEAHLFSVYIGRNFLLMMMGGYFFSSSPPNSPPSNAANPE